VTTRSCSLVVSQTEISLFPMLDGEAKVSRCIEQINPHNKKKGHSFFQNWALLSTAYIENVKNGLCVAQLPKRSCCVLRLAVKSYEHIQFLQNFGNFCYITEKEKALKPTLL